MKEYASLERVTVRTVKNWISKGVIAVRRTPGGRVRIASPRGVMGKSGEISGRLAK